MSDVHTVKVLKLKRHITNYSTEKLHPKDRSEFLDCKPVSSNYLIETVFGSHGLVTKVSDKFNEHRPSSVAINRHLQLENLTDDCEIGLSESQYKRYQKIKKRSKKYVKEQLNQRSV